MTGTDVSFDYFANHRATQETYEYFIESFRLLALPDRSSFREWCEDNIVLSGGTPNPGRWRTDFVPAAVPVYDAVGNHGLRKLVLRGPVQTMKSALIINLIAWFAHVNPDTMALVQPNEMLSQDFAGSRIPQIMGHTRLGPYFERGARTVEGYSKRLERPFPGGKLTFVSPGSTDGLISRPIRTIFIDEISKMAKNPIGLAQSRMTAYGTGSFLLVTSSAGLDGSCFITDELEETDWRRWSLKCQGCGEISIAEWEDVHWPYKRTELACWHCPKCDHPHDTAAVRLANKGGEYTITRPENVRASCVGFDLNALATPTLSLPDLAGEFEKANNTFMSKGIDHLLQTFFCDRIVEPYKPPNTGIRIETVEMLRTDKYPRDLDLLPDDVFLLTAGIDTQDEWIAAELVGWGVAYETGHTGSKFPILTSWGLEYVRFDGPTDTMQPWSDLAEWLIGGHGDAQKKWYVDADRTVWIRPALALVDSGGHSTQQVANFTRNMQALCIGRKITTKVLASKGESRIGRDPFSIPENVRKLKHDYGKGGLVMVGADTIKSVLFNRINRSSNNKKSGQGAVLDHFPGEQAGRGYDNRYPEGLAAEVPEVKIRTGYAPSVVFRRIRGIRAEPLDCRVYAYSAMVGMGAEAEIMRQRGAIKAKLQGGSGF